MRITAYHTNNQPLIVILSAAKKPFSVRCKQSQVHLFKDASLRSAWQST